LGESLSNHEISYLQTMTEELLTTEALRLRVAELAIQVQTAGTACSFQAVRGRPRYQLAPVALVEGERVRACVRIKPDEFRRHFSEIRALVRIANVPFGIVVRGELTAIFQRHPRYHPGAAQRYQAEFLARQNGAPDDLRNWLTAVDNKLAALALSARKSRRLPLQSVW
jgi:hypothetical protein